MKCRLIMDAEGPNPEFNPPNDPKARFSYKVPHSIIIPAGTELPEHHLCWIHCLPKSGMRINPKTRKPERGTPGDVLAEPIDDECRDAVAARILFQDPFKGMTLDAALAKLAQIVEKTKAASGLTEVGGAA